MLFVQTVFFGPPDQQHIDYILTTIVG